jgi:hypothetical protein
VAPLRCQLDLLFLLHNTRLDNLDFLNWSVFRSSLDETHPFNGTHSRLNPAKDCMFSIEPRRRRKRDKELRSIRVWARVGHAQDAGARVLQTWIDLVLKFLAKDGASSATGPCRIATLNHEVGDDAVEDGVVIVAATDEGGEIVAGLWGVRGVQLKNERALQLVSWSVSLL